MTQRTVLVIDDSTTIRRLVDRCLTASGFRVFTADTAEKGLQLLEEIRPDLVLLDHQLPGTTGTEVCQQILQRNEVADIPIVVSSTLRNRAYAEYTELPNVVDMLPKPYTDELLKTTVENALDTAKLVVDSQSQGTAVPEVIEQLGDPDLSGTFASFRIREVIDFLNNANLSGILEVESDVCRVFFHLNHGRVAGVSASGVDADQLSNCLPDSLQNLAPILPLIVGGGTRGQLDGIVELLNRKVVDPRLLRELLRHQAAILTWRCFNDRLKEFRFTKGVPLPSLVSQLPLDSSVAALLIEGALRNGISETAIHNEDDVFTRCRSRGQNLDRAGVSAKHLKVLNGLNERCSAHQLADKLGWNVGEIQCVLRAFELAELVERHRRNAAREILVLETDATIAARWREQLGGQDRYYGKVVRDRLAMQLVLKRAAPEALVFAISNGEVFEAVCELIRSRGESLAGVKWIGLFPADVNKQKILKHLEGVGVEFDATLDHPADPRSLFAVLDDVFQQPVRTCSASEEQNDSKSALKPVVCAETT